MLKCVKKPDIHDVLLLLMIRRILIEVFFYFEVETGSVKNVRYEINDDIAKSQ